MGDGQAVDHVDTQVQQRCLATSAQHPPGGQGSHQAGGSGNPPRHPIDRPGNVERRGFPWGAVVFAGSGGDRIDPGHQPAEGQDTQGQARGDQGQDGFRQDREIANLHPFLPLEPPSFRTGRRRS